MRAPAPFFFGRLRAAVVSVVIPSIPEGPLAFYLSVFYISNY